MVHRVGYAVQEAWGSQSASCGELLHLSAWWWAHGADGTVSCDRWDGYAERVVRCTQKFTDCSGGGYCRSDAQTDSEMLAVAAAAAAAAVCRLGLIQLHTGPVILKDQDETAQRDFTNRCLGSVGTNYRIYFGN